MIRTTASPQPKQVNISQFSAIFAMMAATETSSESEDSVTENWLPVPGHAGLYEVSDLGRVRSLASGAFLSGTPCKGYRNVRLTRDGKNRLWPIHRLVCRAFHGEPADGMMAGHLDGNPTNNRATNLAWITRSENTIHSMKHGTYALNPPKPHRMPGSSHPMAKLTEQEVEQIRARLGAGELRAPIAKDFGVSLTCISSIKTGRHWANG